MGGLQKPVQKAAVKLKFFIELTILAQQNTDSSAIEISSAIAFIGKTLT